MKLKNIALRVTVLLLLGFVFPSCEHNDNFWIRGELDRGDTFYTRNGGLIERSFIVDDRDLYFETNRFKDIDDLRFLGNDEIVLTVSRNYIHELWLNVDGTRVEVVFDDLRGSESFYGGEVARFMRTVVDQVRLNGYAKINVYAENYDYINNIQLDIQLFADIEAYVRD